MTTKRLSSWATPSFPGYWPIFCTIIIAFEEQRVRWTSSTPRAAFAFSPFRCLQVFSLPRRDNQNTIHPISNPHIHEDQKRFSINFSAFFCAEQTEWCCITSNLCLKCLFVLSESYWIVELVSRRWRNWIAGSRRLLRAVLELSVLINSVVLCVISPVSNNTPPLPPSIWDPY